MNKKLMLILTIFAAFYAIILFRFFPKYNPIIFIFVSMGSILLLIIVILLIFFIDFKRNESFITKGKKIIYKGLANHFTTGGYLILTEDELIFKSHLLSTQQYTLRIPLKEIIEVKPINLMSISKGFIIFDHTNSQQFIVFKRNLWVKNIEKLIKK